MTFAIRPYAVKDYPQLATILAEAKPYATTTAELLEYRDQTRPSFCQFERFVAVKDEEVVGYSYYTQYADMFEADAYWIDVCVSSTQQKQGIGSSLYQKLWQSFAGKRPFTFRVQLQEGNAASIQFAEKRGFQEFGRRWESILDVATFDKAHAVKAWANLKKENIQIKSFTELASDPDRDQKLYKLQTELDQDVPMLVPATPMTFAQFAKQILQNPSFVADGLFVALDGSEYVGMSSFFANDDNSLAIDLTGTKKPYRRRGIATALKIQGILFAQEHSYQTITVQNDLVNQEMLAINEKLGFVRSPALIQYARTFSF